MKKREYTIVDCNKIDNYKPIKKDVIFLIQKKYRNSWKTLKELFTEREARDYKYLLELEQGIVI
jgi:hypothetical protein